MLSKAKTVKEYLGSLPEDRRKAIAALRKVIRKNIDKDFKEGMQGGALGYFLPHSKYPSGYHCDPKQPLPFASLASHKGHMALYLFCIYCDSGEQPRFVPPAVFGDALRRLSSAATFLYQDGPRYWYSTQPTVTKLAEDRAEQFWVLFQHDKN